MRHYYRLPATTAGANLPADGTGASERWHSLLGSRRWRRWMTSFTCDIDARRDDSQEGDRSSLATQPQCCR